MFVGLVCAMLTAGAVGLIYGVPLALTDWMPGDDVDELRKLPRNIMFAAFCGAFVGILAGISSQLSGRRIGYALSGLIIAACALATVQLTHPDLNIDVDSTFFDYLESYRLTILASLGGAVGVFLLGHLSRPFVNRDHSRN